MSPVRRHFWQVVGALEAGIAQPHELALELVHAGRREEHRRVVGHQHVAGPADAALGDEEIEDTLREGRRFSWKLRHRGPDKLGRCGGSSDHLAVRSGSAGPRRPRQGKKRMGMDRAVIVQDEEPGGNPGSVRTQGGFLPAQLHFSASLTFLPEPAGVSATGSASGAWSTPPVDRRGPPSLPRAKLGIHGRRS